MAKDATYYLDALRDEVSAYEERVSELKDEVAEYKDIISGLEGQVKDLEHTVTDLEKQLDEAISLAGMNEVEQRVDTMKTR